MYLTPAQFRAMNFGIKAVDSMADAELAAILERASADVDTHCAVPMIPQKHSFTGGTITRETHTWYIDPYATSPRRRAYPYHTPVLEVSRMAIYLDDTSYAEIAPDHIYYEASEGFVEPTDLSLTSYGLFGVMTNFIGTSQPHVELDYTYGYRERIEQLVYYNEGWYAASRGFWVTEPEVRVNSNLRPDTDYEVDADEGRIRFTSNAPVDGDSVQIAVTSSLPYDIAEATGIIAASKIYDRSWASSGFGGLRSVAVAEVRLDRDQARAQGSDLRSNIPAEAADKLEAYVFRTMR